MPQGMRMHAFSDAGVLRGHPAGVPGPKLYRLAGPLASVLHPEPKVYSAICKGTKPDTIATDNAK
jgi:hypothetical protein